jgi:cytidylate kinase
MTEDTVDVDQMRAITISREYGSGGGEVARHLATRLGWQLIDHEIVVQIAQELGISEDEAEAHDERSSGVVSLILNNMRAIYPTMFTNVPTLAMTDDEVYCEALTKVVEAAVAAARSVIVGRGGQVILRDRRDALHVRIVAPLEKRIEYVMKREALDQSTARSRIQLKDHDRQRYLQTVYHLHPSDAHLYDLVINTGVLDLDGAVDLICLALALKARRLTVPEEALGPGAGLQPYPGRPEDLRPPTGI